MYVICMNVHVISMCKHAVHSLVMPKSQNHNPKLGKFCKQFQKLNIHTKPFVQKLIMIFHHLHPILRYLSNQKYFNNNLLQFPFFIIQQFTLWSKWSNGSAMINP